MKVLFYGHSFVLALCNYCHWDKELEVGGERVEIDCHFRYHSGKDYQFVLNRPREFEALAEVNPDIVVIIFGANLSLSTTLTQKSNSG
ncbi:hypothetical protein E2C01_080670 [Portunus trituberculatus]|uniref:Uncharacterized protein n=1 Tax=Portunus trituberculatus TaxID=210409 RepID=A0A5B7IK95_PORTR|nr:hypothetical protein [Portunus trituberculatus]